MPNMVMSNEEMNAIVNHFGGRKQFQKSFVDPFYVKAGYCKDLEETRNLKGVAQQFGLLSLDYCLMINSKAITGVEFSEEELDKKFKACQFFAKDLKGSMMYQNHYYALVDGEHKEYKDGQFIELDKLGKMVVLADRMYN